MTPDESEHIQYLVCDCRKELTKAIECGDPDIAHKLADEAIIEFIENLGFPYLADLWRKVEKWYA